MYIYHIHRNFRGKIFHVKNSLSQIFVKQKIDTQKFDTTKV